MKQLILIILSFILLSSGCRKNKNPVDQLPPETQTGANTFGCLVNGQAFKPGGAQLSGGSLNCFYQFVNNGYYFGLSGTYQSGGGNTQSSVSLFTDSLKIQKNIKYLLRAERKGEANALYTNLANGASPSDWFYRTQNNINEGEIWITNLDTIKQIVSGTFWFDAVNANGQIVQIRDGRFDVRYTR